MTEFEEMKDNSTTNITKDYEEEETEDGWMRFVFDGVCLTSVSIFGIACNFISVIVLLRPKMR